MEALVLLSGGLDSTVILAEALARGRTCYALSFNYGQQHAVELDAAACIADYYDVPHEILSIATPAFSLSSLLNGEAVPKGRTPKEIESGIPSTYVPARNTLFLSYALAHAELLQADEIYIGANGNDAIPYPDCRPEYYTAFQALINVATQQAVESQPPKLVTPLLHLNKAAIVARARGLSVPIELTYSCYSPKSDGHACGTCDACTLRAAALC